MVLDGVNSAQLQYYVLHGVLAAKGILKHWHQGAEIGLVAKPCKKADRKLT